MYTILGRTCVNGCPPLSVIFGEVSYNRSAVGGRYPVGTQGTYHCDTRKWYGSNSRICQQSGVWNGEPAICERSNNKNSYQHCVMPNTKLY